MLLAFFFKTNHRNNAILQLNKTTIYETITSKRNAAGIG